MRPALPGAGYVRFGADSVRHLARFRHWQHAFRESGGPGASVSGHFRIQRPSKVVGYKILHGGITGVRFGEGIASLIIALIAYGLNGSMRSVGLPLSESPTYGG